MEGFTVTTIPAEQPATLADIMLPGALVPVVVGQQDPDGWKVVLIIAGLRVALTPAEARKLCVEVTGMADLIDDGFLP